MEPAGLKQLQADRPAAQPVPRIPPQPETAPIGFVPSPALIPVHPCSSVAIKPLFPSLVKSNQSLCHPSTTSLTNVSSYSMGPWGPCCNATIPPPPISVPL